MGIPTIIHQVWEGVSELFPNFLHNWEKPGKNITQRGNIGFGINRK